MIQANDVTYIELGDDGREICQDCYGSAILDTKSFESLIEKCHEFYKSMNMEIGNNVPFFLVDSSEMAQVTTQIDQDNPFEVNFKIIDDIYFYLFISMYSFSFIFFW